MVQSGPEWVTVHHTPRTGGSWASPVGQAVAKAGWKRWSRGCSETGNVDRWYRSAHTPTWLLCVYRCLGRSHGGCWPARGACACPPQPLCMTHQGVETAGRGNGFWDRLTLCGCLSQTARTRGEPCNERGPRKQPGLGMSPENNQHRVSLPKKKKTGLGGPGR